MSPEGQNRPLVGSSVLRQRADCNNSTISAMPAAFRVIPTFSCNCTSLRLRDPLAELKWNHRFFRFPAAVFHRRDAPPGIMHLRGSATQSALTSTRTVAVGADISLWIDTRHSRRRSFESAVTPALRSDPREAARESGTPGHPSGRSNCAAMGRTGGANERADHNGSLTRSEVITRHRQTARLEPDDIARSRALRREQFMLFERANRRAQLRDVRRLDRHSRRQRGVREDRRAAAGGRVDRRQRAPHLADVTGPNHR